jgi:hypothetical protein
MSRKDASRHDATISRRRTRVKRLGAAAIAIHALRVSMNTEPVTE